MKKFLFKPDGSLKDPESLSGTPDELAQMIVDENPELVINESMALSGINKTFQDSAYDYKHEDMLSRKGVTKRERIDYRLLPYQEFDRNKDGSINTDQDGRPIVKIKSQQVKDKSGKVIGDEISDDVFNSFTSSPQGVALVQARFKYVNNQLKASGRTPIEDGTPEALSLKKQLVQNILSQNQPLRSSVGSFESDATRLQAIQGGYAPPGRTPPSDDSQEKFENTSIGRLNDLAINGVDISGLEEVTHGNGKTSIKGHSVKGIVGKFLGSSGKEYADIVYDQKDKSFNFVPEELSKPIKKVPAKDMPAFLKGNYKINGVKNEDVSRIGGGPAVKTVKKSEIAAIASNYVNPATGKKYTADEYEAALIKANVRIIN